MIIPTVEGGGRPVEGRGSSLSIGHRGTFMFGKDCSSLQFCPNFLQDAWTFLPSWNLWKGVRSAQRARELQTAPERNANRKPLQLKMMPCSPTNPDVISGARVIFLVGGCDLKWKPRMGNSSWSHSCLDGTGPTGL